MFRVVIEWQGVFGSSCKLPKGQWRVLWNNPVETPKWFLSRDECWNAKSVHQLQKASEDLVVPNPFKFGSVNLHTSSIYKDNLYGSKSTSSKHNVHFQKGILLKNDYHTMYFEQFVVCGSCMHNRTSHVQMERITLSTSKRIHAALHRDLTLKCHIIELTNIHTKLRPVWDTRIYGNRPTATFAGSKSRLYRDTT